MALRRRPIRVARRARRRAVIRKTVPKLASKKYREQVRTNFRNKVKRGYNRVDTALHKSSNAILKTSTLLATGQAYARKYGMSGRRIGKVSSYVNKAREYLPNSLGEVFGKDGVLATYQGPGSSALKQVMAEANVIGSEVAEVAGPIIEAAETVAPILLV